MFSFLNPIFLWGALVAVVPLILHLMQRRRIIRLPFSTIRFLQMAEKRSAQRIRIENLLLWLLRTVILLALVLAFAMPVLRTRSFGGLLRRARRDVAIVLDGSYSMTYASRLGTVWDQSVEVALDIVDGLHEGDRVCIYVARDYVDAVLECPTADRDLAAAQLRALHSSPTGSQLMPALAEAHAALREGGLRRQREIHIITDGQAVPWEEFSEGNADAGSATGIWPPSPEDPRTAIFVTLTGAATPRNAWVDAVQVQPTLVVSGMPCRVSVDVGSMGTGSEPVVALFLNDERLTERSAGGVSGSVSFNLPRLRPGVHRARAELAADSLVQDDAFHFLVRVRERLPVLCVGGEQDVFFLSKALAPRGPGSLVSVEHAGDHELLSAPLEEYLAVFLCNALPMPGQAIARLDDYVERGGLMVVFPGDRARVSDYSAWQCLGEILPSAVEELPSAMRKQTLRWDDPPHELLQPILPDPGSAPIVPIHRHLAWDAADRLDVPLRSGADTPFLVTTLHGKGRVVLVAVPADRSWSGLPLSPFYLPLVHRLAQVGAGIMATQPFAWGARRLPISDFVPRVSPLDTFAAPDGTMLPVRGNGGNGGALWIEDMTLPGVYVQHSPGGQETVALAIDMTRRESNLTPVAVETVPELIATDRVSVSRGRQELVRALGDYREGRTLGEQLLWLALIAAVVEAVYANWKARHLAGDANRLRVNLAGKLVVRRQAKT